MVVIRNLRNFFLPPNEIFLRQTFSDNFETDCSDYSQIAKKKRADGSTAKINFES